MNDKLVDFLMEKTDQFGNVINELAKQMGVAAEHIYGVIVRQQYVEGIAGIIGSIFGLAVGIFLLIASFKSKKYWERKFEDNTNNYRYDSDTILVRWIGMFLGFVAIVVSVIVGMQFLMHLLNPEYYALRDIMEMIRGELEKND